MDIAVTELRSRLADVLELVRGGEDVTVIQHGLPVARLSPLGSTDVLDRLTRDGIIRRPAAATKLVARGRQRTVATEGPPIAGLVADQRDPSR